MDRDVTAFTFFNGQHIDLLQAWSPRLKTNSSVVFQGGRLKRENLIELRTGKGIHLKQEM